MSILSKLSKKYKEARKRIEKNKRVKKYRLTLRYTYPCKNLDEARERFYYLNKNNKTNNKITKPVKKGSKYYIYVINKHVINSDMPISMLRAKYKREMKRAEVSIVRI